MINIIENQSKILTFFVRHRVIYTYIHLSLSISFPHSKSRQMLCVIHDSLTNRRLFHHVGWVSLVNTYFQQYQSSACDHFILIIPH